MKLQQPHSTYGWTLTELLTERWRRPAAIAENHVQKVGVMRCPFWFLNPAKLHPDVYGMESLNLSAERPHGCIDSNVLGDSEVQTVQAWIFVDKMARRVSDSLYDGNITTFANRAGRQWLRFSVDVMGNATGNLRASQRAGQPCACRGSYREFGAA